MFSLRTKKNSFCFLYADVYTGNLTLLNGCVPPLSLEMPPTGPSLVTKASNISIYNGVPMITNEATAYLDLHQVYGPSTAINSALRTFSGGLLLTNNYYNVTTSPAFVFGFFQYGDSAGPYNCIDCPPSWGQTGGAAPVNPLLNPTLSGGLIGPNQVFVSGDPRVGENGALTMFHTLFIRNHNRHAGIVASENPTWNDEAIFQEARRRNIAEYQAVVLYQYFPTEFGPFFNDLLGPYVGYDEYLDVDTNIAFSSAAFRYGHSSFHNYVPLDSCGNPTLFGQSAFPGDQLFEGAQTGGPVTPIDVIGEIGTFENLIRGLINEVTAPNDIMIDDTLRDIPFRVPVPGGTDLLALDIHRGRENGIQNYAVLQTTYGSHDLRIYGAPGCPEKYGHKTDPDPLSCFTNLVPYNATLAANLQSIYTKVNNIDGIVGLMVEPHVDGTSFGYTLVTIITDQYQRARAGDRFWFENLFQANPFTLAQIASFQATTMGYLLRQNFDFVDPSQVPNNPYLSPSNYLFTLGHSC